MFKGFDAEGQETVLAIVTSPAMTTLLPFSNRPHRNRIIERNGKTPSWTLSRFISSLSLSFFFILLISIGEINRIATSPVKMSRLGLRRLRSTMRDLTAQETKEESPPTLGRPIASKRHSVYFQVISVWPQMKSTAIGPGPSGQ